MKKALLILLLASVALQCLSQQKTTGREKKHTPVSSIFRKQSENILLEREKSLNEKFSQSFEMRNNAKADSILMSAVGFIDKLDFDWQVVIKEIPVYKEGTNLIEELERWYRIGPDKAYEPYEKYVAAYDDQERVTRIEYYWFDNGKWQPQFAEEMTFDHIGQEIFYAWFVHDEDLDEWVLEEGYRAVDDHNENGTLVKRVWENYYMYYMDDWMPSYMEEYKLNDDDVVIEMIESYYADWDKGWVYEFRLKFELDENNMWASGYGYTWDCMYEEWYPELKYTDIQWFNFDFLQIASLTTLINPDIWEDWDDFDKRSEEDIEWENYMRLHMEYTNDGLITLMINEFWVDEDDINDWIPVMREEIEYDHFNNMVYMTFSVYDYYDLEDWVLVYGFKFFMNYNDDLSINSYEFFILFDGYWKSDYEPVMRSEYFYPTDDDPTSTNPIEAASPMVSVYPNPASSMLNVVWEGADQQVMVSIIGIDGKTIANHGVMQAYPGQPITLDVSGLKKGVYFIVVSTGDARQTTRFIKS